MRKIIHGKRYDTATATKIASWHNGHFPNDFHHCEETLYRTAKGQYFLHGEGGALSAYAVHHGNSRGAGEDIIVMDRNEARLWLEGHGCTEALESEFGREIKDA